VRKSGLLIVFILVMSFVSISCVVASKQYPFSENPYDDVYEINFYSENNSLVMTSRTCPIIEGNTIIVTNYWWREFDEEGNEEWLRYHNDFYRSIIPLNNVSVEVIHITDKNNTAHVVEMWGR